MVVISYYGYILPKGDTFGSKLTILVWDHSEPNHVICTYITMMLKSSPLEKSKTQVIQHNTIAVQKGGTHTSLIKE